MVLISCDTGSAGFGAQNFQLKYNQARDALEAGQYSKAERGYARLMGQAGPLAPRVRLEYAHVLLRMGDFERATVEADQAMRGLPDEGRAAALAVRATADHEIGLKALNAGDADKGAQHLRRADAGMAEVLQNHADLDPVGALAARRASIAVRLKGL